ncbi:MAG: N-6 DNA methylase, partial [Pseudomonadota bacterium]
MSSVKDYKKLFVNELDWFSARGHTPWQVFGDFLELGAIALHQLPYNAGDFPKGETFQHYESQYLERSGRYSRDELTRISAMTWYTNLALQQEPRDFLGEIAGEQELLNQDGGQFFTPYSLCKVMAGFQFSNIESLVKEKGRVTVDDPASGGGAMLIAAAEACMEQGIDPRTHLQFHATDVSRNAFNMTYIQLAALDLQATVRHGNTLSNELWEARPTPQLRYFDQWRQQRLADIRSERAIEAMRRIITSDVVETSALEATVSEPEVT